MKMDILERFINNERGGNFSTYSLEPVKALLEKLGNPHDKIKTVHVAGTNGKGSTAFYLNEIFRRAGYSTGLYTSPHLKDIRERIRVNGEIISPESFIRLTHSVVETADQTGGLIPTYFDILTVTGFLAFAEAGVDIAIIETGLGGRKDSTNVLAPLCSIVTSVSYDHMAILGDTIESIAGEKAGIIKPGVPAVTSNRDATVVSVLKEQCERLDSPFYGLENDFFAEDIRKVEEGYLYDYRLSDHGKEVLIRGIRVNSPVYEQIENTCVAITAALLLRDVFHMISPAGIAAALDRFSPPGRFMWLSGNPVMLYDPAHNYGAVSSLISAVTRLYPGKSVVAIITFMRDKDYRAIIPL
jgi:dihydrofolate synthase/folylpolyglutamate synthase